MRPALIALIALIALVAASLAACAEPRPKDDWADHGPPPAGAPGGAAATLDLSAPLLSDLPPREDAMRPATAKDYPPPPGGRLVATFQGPARPAATRDLELPLPLWLPAVPPELGQAFTEEKLADELLIDGTEELDLDGDQKKELVVLARPAALFEQEGPHRFALLLAFSRDGDTYRLVAAHTFVPQRHQLPGTPARWCPADWALAGTLKREGRQLPLVHEFRGVSCGVLVGGGFDRVVHVVDLGKPGAASSEGLVARARLGPQRSAEIYDGVAYAADLDADGDEELAVRGVSIGARPCGAGLDPAYWIEELAWRAISPDGTVRAIRGRAALPLAGGALPAQLLQSHPAGCGPIPELGIRPE